MANRLSLDYFDPGQTVMLEKWTGRRQTKGLSKIIGAREPYYLLVDMPFVKNRALFIHGDKQCTVRFLNEGAVIGFRARIEKILLEPFPLLVLLYPEEFEEMIVRETDRVGCNIPARLMPLSAPPAAGAEEETPPGAKPAKALLEQTDLPQPDEPLHATILDLSVGGCQVGLPCIEEGGSADRAEGLVVQIPPEKQADYHPLILKSLCAQERKLRLDFATPGTDGNAAWRAECGVCWSRVFRGYYLLGLRFLDLPEEMAEWLRKTIEIQRTFFTQPFEPQ